MQFSYIAGSEAEQYEFVRIPKTLISSDYFADLSNPSRILYGLLFARMRASPKNRWLDSEGHVYVREESQELPAGTGKDRADRAEKAGPRISKSDLCTEFPSGE